MTKNLSQRRKRKKKYNGFLQLTITNYTVKKEKHKRNWNMQNKERRKKKAEERNKGKK